MTNRANLTDEMCQALDLAAQRACDALNVLAKADPHFMAEMVIDQLPVTDELAETNLCVVEQSLAGGWKAGMLGVINGILRTRDDNGPILVEYDDKTGDIIEFRLVKEYRQRVFGEPPEGSA